MRSSVRPRPPTRSFHEDGRDRDQTGHHHRHHQRQGRRRQDQRRRSTWPRRWRGWATASASSTPTSASATSTCMLGLTPQLHLGHFLTGERELEEIMVEGPLRHSDHSRRHRHPRPDGVDARAVEAPRTHHPARQHRPRLPADRHRRRHLRQRRRAAADRRAGDRDHVLRADRRRRRLRDGQDPDGRQSQEGNRPGGERRAGTRTRRRWYSGSSTSRRPGS